MAESNNGNGQPLQTFSHAASPKLAAPPNVYESEYLGSGTFRISKPKRQPGKQRQSALKGTTRGARK